MTIIVRKTPKLYSDINKVNNKILINFGSLFYPILVRYCTIRELSLRVCCVKLELKSVIQDDFIRPKYYFSLLISITYMYKERVSIADI